MRTLWRAPDNPVGLYMYVHHAIFITGPGGCQRNGIYRLQRTQFSALVAIERFCLHHSKTPENVDLLFKINRPLLFLCHCTSAAAQVTDVASVESFRDNATPCRDD